jgi:hypothetical protein
VTIQIYRCPRLPVQRGHSDKNRRTVTASEIFQIVNVPLNQNDDNSKTSGFCEPAPPVTALSHLKREASLAATRKELLIEMFKSELQAGLISLH